MVSDRLRRVVEFLQTVQGVRKVIVLGNVEREALLQAELRGEKSVIGGQGFNEGVREALSREFVVACSTDKRFKWPKGPYVVLKSGDTVVGFITDDVENIKRQCNEETYVFGGSLILFPDRIRKLKDKEKATIFVYKGFKMEALEAEADVKDAVLAFCTRAGDAYLKRLLGESEDASIGTIVVGFNLEKRGEDKELEGKC